jgi:hypothetical protein
VVIQQFAIENHYSNFCELGESSDYMLVMLAMFILLLFFNKKQVTYLVSSPLLHLRAGQNRLLVLGHGLLLLLQLIEPRLKVLTGRQDLLQLLTGDMTIPATQKNRMELGDAWEMGGFMMASTYQ